MASSGQEKSPKKLSQSGRVASIIESMNREARSSSASGDNEHEQNSKPVETTEKQSFKEIRERFEQNPPHLSKKRTSVPATTKNLINNQLNVFLKTPLEPKTENCSNISPNSSRPTSAKFEQFVKPKPQITPAFKVEINDTLSKAIFRVSVQSDSEQNRPVSPSTKATDSVILIENDNGTQLSVGEKREMFDKHSSRHFYQDRSSDSKAQSTNNKSDFRGPPPRPPPRPEHYIKSQLSDWYSAPTSDAVDSATGDSSLSSSQNLSRDDSSDESFTDEEECFESEQKLKLRKCIEEVHSTEKTYVNILYVLSVKLSAEVKNTCDKDENVVLIFNNTYKPLLGNIHQIYKLHHEFILPEFEAFITGHRTGNMWSVLEERYKYIEVLYKSYYVTYADIQGKLEDLCKTYPLINEAMLKCQFHLGNLFPITQLNCPNQRLLRYILCLKTYMKYLKENSSEYKHTRSIHDELDRIAGRCEEELVVSSSKLSELNERLENKFECIKDQRKLLWHGSLKKQSPRRNTEIAQRYLILFSDCLLLCYEESGRKLEVNRELSLRNITIDFAPGGRTLPIQTTDQQTNGTTFYPFRVNAVEKSYEFLTDKESEREVWVRKLRQASDDFNKRNTTIEMRNSISRTDEQQLGIRAPAWVNDNDVTRCQNCNSRFPTTTILLTRRHHCRSCGRCICGQCSTKKLILEYCRNEGEVRVCDVCYTHFTGTVLSKNTSVWPKVTREVEETILFGDFRTVNSGTIVWIALQEDFYLHVYGGRLDQAEDYSIKLPDLVDIQLDSETRVFTLQEITKTHTLTIEINHQLTYQKNDFLEDKMKNSDNKLTFYTNLWFEAMQLARSTTFPKWYTRKRDSADSGVSNVG